MRSLFSAGLILVLGVLSLSCDDDDDPVAGNQPCSGSTSCFDLTLGAPELTYNSFYDVGADQTTHTLEWTIGSRVINGYAPGRKIVATITFNPPIAAQYAHLLETFSLIAGSQAVCFDRSATPNADVASSGWTASADTVRCEGACSDGASKLTTLASFGPLQADDQMSQLSFEFTVPSTYTDGASQGEPVLPGNLTVRRVLMIAVLDGDTEGLPPAYQGEPPATARRPR